MIQLSVKGNAWCDVRDIDNMECNTEGVEITVGWEIMTMEWGMAMEWDIMTVEQGMMTGIEHQL